MALAAYFVGVLALLAFADAQRFGVPGLGAVGRLPGANLVSGAVGDVTNAVNSAASAMPSIPVPNPVAAAQNAVDAVTSALPELPNPVAAARNAVDAVTSALPAVNIPEANIITNPVAAEQNSVASALPAVPGLDQISNIPASLPSLPSVSGSLSSAMNVGTSLTSAIPTGIPGLGNMMSLASGGIGAVIQMLLKMIDLSMITNAIQQASNILRAALQSGLRLLDLKIEDIFGVKQFSSGAEELGREAGVPQFIIDAIMAFTAIASQALLSV